MRHNGCVCGGKSIMYISMEDVNRIKLVLVKKISKMGKSLIVSFYVNDRESEISTLATIEKYSFFSKLDSLLCLR